MEEVLHDGLVISDLDDLVRVEMDAEGISHIYPVNPVLEDEDQEEHSPLSQEEREKLLRKHKESVEEIRLRERRMPRDPRV